MNTYFIPWTGVSTVDINQRPAQQVPPVLLYYVIACDQINLIKLVKLATRIKIQGLFLHFMPSNLRRMRSILNNVQKKTQN